MKELEHIAKWLDSDLSALTKDGVIAALRRMLDDAELEAPQGEFTKDLRGIVERAKQVNGRLGRAIGCVLDKKEIEELLQTCDRLDRQATELKDLKTKNAQIAAHAKKIATIDDEQIADVEGENKLLKEAIRKGMQQIDLSCGQAAYSILEQALTD